MAKRKTHKEDRKGWPLFNRLLADYIELTRFPELPVYLRFFPEPPCSGTASGR